MNGPTFAAAAPPAAKTARPAGPSAPARPPAKADADNPAVRVLTYLKLHWLTILFLGALLGGGLAYAAWVLFPPKYESYALFRITSSPAGIATASDPTRGKTEFETYRKTSAAQLKYEFVYSTALREEYGGISKLPTLRDEKDPFKFFDEQLVVDTKEGSEIVKLSLSGERPDDVRKIVDAVRQAYLAEVVEKDKRVRSLMVDDLKAAKVKLEGMMKARIGGLAPPPPVAGVAAAVVTDPAAVPAAMDRPPGLPPAEKPAAPAADESLTVKHAKFSKLVDRLSKLELDTLPSIDPTAAQLVAEAARIKADLDKKAAEPDDGETEKAVKNDPEYLAAERTVKARRADYRNELASATSPTAPAVREAAKALEVAEIAAQKVLDDKKKTVEALRRKPAADALAEQYSRIGRELERLAALKKVTVAEIARIQAELRDIPPPLSEAKAEIAAKGKEMDPQVTELVTTERLYDLVNTRLTAATLDLQAPDRIQPLQPASTPSVKDSKKQLFGAVFGGLLGFALVGGVCVLLEMGTRKVSSLAELKSVTPTPVVGVVPWAPDAATARDPAKRADVNEAIDKLRAYVAQTWLSRGATTVTVTSPLGDEGKAFTAFGLASSLAQAGYRTLLADFDLRSPALHPFAGVANNAGVCELLRGEADFRGTIQVLPNGLHFLTAGKWSDEARQAAVGGRLEALLTRLKEPFDCVVLHGHALLTVAETVEVARRSEVVLLCALYRDTRGPLLKKATERVATMEIPFSGVVYVGATPNEALC